MRDIEQEAISALYEKQIIELDENKLNDWESTFIADMKIILGVKDSLSVRQAEKLSQIWNKHGRV